MKIPRFLIDKKIENIPNIIITDEAVIHQIKDVLRLRVGDEVILIDGSGGLYHSRVKILMKKESNFERIRYESVDNFGSRSITLACSVLKKDKYEWVLQKCTELGVSEFVPIISHRTEKIGLNMERMKNVLKEAVEQSERFFIPKLSEPISLEDYVNEIKKDSVGRKIIYLDFVKQKLDVSQFKEEKNLVIFVGPEGGWSEEDRKIFSENSIEPFSINDYVLRAETAAVSVVASIVMA